MPQQGSDRQPRHLVWCDTLRNSHSVTRTLWQHINTTQQSFDYNIMIDASSETLKVRQLDKNFTTVKL